MQVSVSGPLGGAVPQELHVAEHKAAMHFAKQLGIQRLHTTVLIRIHQQAQFMGDCEGLCEAIDKRHYAVDVALWGNWLSTLAHEMVHVKQWAREELSMNMEQWKSRPYCGNIEYWDQPWEREARRLQGRMLEDYTNNPGNPTII